MRVAKLLAAAALFLPVPAAAQGPELAAVDSLARAGNVHAARDRLQVWWERELDRASRTDLQWGLWLRARLTVDPEMAALDYKRLAVEHPGSELAAEALLRLARSALARGDAAEATEHFEAIRREHPGSAARLEADAWLDGDRAARSLVSTQPGPRSGAHAVQLGAFSGEEGAAELLALARAAGLDVRLALVEGDELVRVRVGRFTERGEAEALLLRVRSMGFAATLAEDAHREVELR